MSSAKKLMGTTAVGGALAIEDVFSTYLYNATGTTNTITNGIDLAGEGGMVWFKKRSTSSGHGIFDTERGATNFLRTNVTNAQSTASDTLTSFNSDGFSLGADTSWDLVNGTYGPAPQTYASWTWRKAPRFFDVVTYTGNGATNRQIAHNLGVAPGCIIVKRTDSSASWRIYHHSIWGDDGFDTLQFDTSAADQNNSSFSSGGYSPTDAIFYVDGTYSVGTNTNGASYVAYLFAHDPLGPSGDGSDGLIACGSYTGNGSTNGPEINLGWEPQWVMVKNASGTGNWVMFDTMRGMPVGSGDAYLAAESSGAEAIITADGRIDPTATGFKVVTTSTGFNTSGSTYIYIAIRRGPMRQPTSGTEVFKAALHSGSSGLEQFIPSGGAGFPVDLLISASRGDSNGRYKYFINRLADMWSMTSTSTAAEVFGPSNPIANIGGYQDTIRIGAAGEISGSSWGYVDYYFRRAPSFFDVVAYKGTGSPRWVNHNLTVTPEMVITKSRVGAYSWAVYHKDAAASGDVAENSWMFLNQSQAVSNASGSDYWNSTAPTDTQFRVGTDNTTNRGAGDPPYIAYLFATLPGVSKVGSYTGNGSSQTIDCGFTTGARFVLIKRTDSTGDWYTFNTARGIVAGNDPWIRINNTDQEGTTDDSIDPDSSGFIVNQVATTSINVSSASYIYLAIA